MRTTGNDDVHAAGRVGGRGGIWKGGDDGFRSSVKHAGLENSESKLSQHPACQPNANIARVRLKRAPASVPPREATVLARVTI